MSINTIDYGPLDVRYQKEFTRNVIVDTFTDSEGNFYEVRPNLDGKLVALLVE